MNIFNLPDLGEGLPDAEIHEWFVKEGDVVELDQPIVAMETAKAVVEVPAPQRGTIVKCYGKPGDMIKTGAPLIAFAEDKQQTTDKGTVVGKLEESSEVSEDVFSIGIPTPSNRPKATPATRLLARKLGIDLSSIQGTGENQLITREDIENIAKQQAALPEGYEPLHGVRRAMLGSMNQSHLDVVPVSIFDEVDINAWEPHEDITVRLIRAILAGVKMEPALNAWFDKAHAARKIIDDVHLGLAMDTKDGLFVPVLANIAGQSDADLRNQIEKLKQTVQSRTTSPEQFKGATFTLSNFGKFSGRYATPIIVPPQVAILAVGRLYEGAAVENGNLNVHRFLPLSLTFDHRAITGGEATRFLGAVITCLQKSSAT